MKLLFKCTLVAKQCWRNTDTTGGSQVHLLDTVLARRLEFHVEKLLRRTGEPAWAWA